MSQTFKVEIFAHTYHLRGELDEAAARALAAEVDARMRSIAETTGMVDSARIAVLAALSLADELHELRRIHGALRDDLRSRTERCLALLEQALERTA